MRERPCGAPFAKSIRCCLYNHPHFHIYPSPPPSPPPPNSSRCTFFSIRSPAFFTGRAPYGRPLRCARVCVCKQVMLFTKGSGPPAAGLLGEAKSTQTAHSSILCTALQGRNMLARALTLSRATSLKDSGDKLSSDARKACPEHMDPVNPKHVLTTKNALMVNACCTWTDTSGSSKVATRSPLLNEKRFSVEVAAERARVSARVEFYHIPHTRFTRRGRWQRGGRRER